MNLFKRQSQKKTKKETMEEKEVSPKTNSVNLNNDFTKIDMVNHILRKARMFELFPFDLTKYIIKFFTFFMFDTKTFKISDALIVDQTLNMIIRIQKKDALSYKAVYGTFEIPIGIENDQTIKNVNWKFKIQTTDPGNCMIAISNEFKQTACDSGAYHLKGWFVFSTFFSFVFCVFSTMSCV